MKLQDRGRASGTSNLANSAIFIILHMIRVSLGTCMADAHVICTFR